MYIVTVALKVSPQLLQFHFNTEAAAVNIIGLIQTPGDYPPLRFEDDFGSVTIIARDSIAGIFLTDMEKEMQAQEKVEYIKIQKDMRVRKRLQQDPAARILMPTNGQQS